MQTAAVFSGGLTVEVGWLNLELAATRRIVCIRQMNRVNYRSGLP